VIVLFSAKHLTPKHLMEIQAFMEKTAFPVDMDLIFACRLLADQKRALARKTEHYFLD